MVKILIRLLFVAVCFVGTTQAESPKESVIEEIHAKWGFVIVSNGKFEEVNVGDVINIQAKNKKIVELIVAEVKDAHLVAEFPPKNSKKIAWLAPGDLVISHRKGEKSDAKVYAGKAGEDDDVEVIGWNKQWGFIVVRAKDGTESIRFDPEQDKK
jgi:hypothetical protein